MIRLLGWVLALAVQVRDGDKEPTDRLVPPGWEINPWGPIATQARADGTLPPIPFTPQMHRWDDWGHAVLKDGDLLFRRGDARLMFGYFPFSRFIARTSGSLYSHVGTVSIEDGDPFVYDTTKAGVRRQPFAVWVLDNTGPIGVKRLKPELQDRVPQVVGFCRHAYEVQVPFDYNLNFDSDALYCAEMAEKAFRSAGLKLSDPIRLGDMENAMDHPIAIFVLQYMSEFLLDQPLSLEQLVIFPGNDRFGLWSAPVFEAVYPPPAGKAASAAKSVPPPPDAAPAAPAAAPAAAG